MIVALAYTKFNLEQWFPTFSTCGLPTTLHLTKKRYQWRSQPKIWRAKIIDFGQATILLFWTPLLKAQNG